MDAKTGGKSLSMGPLDPSASHNLGGVAIIADSSRLTISVKPATKALEEAYETGRVAHFAVTLGGNRALSCYNIYG